jgi:hypothetical protein
VLIQISEDELYLWLITFTFVCLKSIVFSFKSKDLAIREIIWVLLNKTNFFNYLPIIDPIVSR